LREDIPKQRAGVGVNGKRRRNKQKALAFLLPQARDYFCIISSRFTEWVEAYVLDRFLWFPARPAGGVSWRNKK